MVTQASPAAAPVVQPAVKQVPPNPPPTPPVAAITPAVAAKPKTLQDLLSQFVTVKEILDISSHFTHEGVCTKCGWHTMQLSDKAARQLTQQHVQQHWRDVTTQVQR
jgi:hypothetical protein